MQNDAIDLTDVDDAIKYDPDCIITNLNRINVLRELNACHTEKTQLSTLTLDRVLHKLMEFPGVKTTITFTNIPSTNAPYYERYVTQSMVDDGSTILVVPICDGSHIFSFVINVIFKEIVYIDSIPTEKRSNNIQRFLANVVFDGKGNDFL